MRDTFLFVDGGLFTPKRGNNTRGYVEGAAMCRLKEFSPTSRDHIAWAFETFRGWEATERTPSGRAKIDDTVLKEIGTPEALKFSRILELQKHLGQLSDGKNAWLKLERTAGSITPVFLTPTPVGKLTCVLISLRFPLMPSTELFNRAW
jgi:DNA polymerase-1